MTNLEAREAEARRKFPFGAVKTRSGRWFAASSLGVEDEAEFGYLPLEAILSRVKANDPEWIVILDGVKG